MNTFLKLLTPPVCDKLIEDSGVAIHGSMMKQVVALVVHDDA